MNSTTGSSLPRVSIICRTVFRDTLSEALRSVEAQTWPNVELVIVDATGKNQPPAELTDLTFVFAGGDTPLDRPGAANAGLKAATGDYLLFLDDDDWISEDHIQRLADTLVQSKALVCYSNTRIALNDGTLTEEVIDEAFSITKLRRDNFMPIHSVMFARQLLETGCEFDESLAIYEDWDFWLQCAQHTTFAKADHIGAYYRKGGDSLTMIDEHAQRYDPAHPAAEARSKVLHKWRSTWSGSEWNELIGLIDQQPKLQQMNTELAAAHQGLHDANREIAKLHILKHELEILREEHQDLQAAHTELNHTHEALDQSLREVLSSFSWRVTAPYRFLRFRLRRWIPVKRHRARPQPASTAETEEFKDLDQNGELQGGILTPLCNNTLFTQAPTIQAWAWSPEKLATIILSLDGTPIIEQAATRTEETVDLAKRIGMAWSLSDVDLTPGSHQIDITITDCAGNAIKLSRSILIQRPALRYQHYLGKHQSEQTGSPVPETGFNIILRLNNQIDQQAINITLESLAAQSFNSLLVYVWAPAGDLPEFKTDLPLTFISQLSELPDKSNRFTVFLEPGEKLYEHCLWEVASSRQRNLLVYSDHDNYNQNGKRTSPWFTWEWSPDFLLSTHYIGDVFFFRHSLITEATLEQTLPTDHAAWRYSLLLTLTDSIKQDQVRRIPLSLWGSPEQTTLTNQELMDAVEHYLPRHCAHETHSQATGVTVNSQTGYRRIHWQAAQQPRVSIIIPTTGNMHFLKPCLDTLADSQYPDLEVIVLDNGRGQHPDGIKYANDKGATVIECNEAFNWSRLNNIGAKNSDGEILLFLNDDIEVTDKDWLNELVPQALREDVGTVGCLLLYPNGTIQHGGVFLVDHGGGARHLFHRQLPDNGIYLQLDSCVREVSANTGACLMISREKFEKLGGFDETLAVAGNDIDFCLRSLEAGFRNVWTPHCQLIHHESVSRQNKPTAKDEHTLWKRWGNRFNAGDPYYNPNLSQNREDCVLR